MTLALKSLFSANQTDEWLVLRYAQSGDKKLLEQLYDNCADDLYHFLLTQSDPELAKDICQKTWLKVIEKPHLYNETGRFIAWLFTLGRNALIDEFRKSNRVELREQQDLPNQSCEFDENDSLSDVFDKALLCLPFEQREAFCLQQEGFGLQEIADITHCPVETAKSRIRYAKQTMRSQLEKYYD
ncbi:sigma-70 family RNA polymerase sigma factor [Aliiglaciecola sp. LCG003]|nr:sigma-70 family RNA polymerase sigma factor [Aliiglaciecola sp. LCG003]WJG11233.1 sigma-70 family RNA polymerase sigma factor [Aliiglaciecola sp. LCG003]